MKLVKWSGMAGRYAVEFTEDTSIQFGIRKNSRHWGFRAMFHDCDIYMSFGLGPCASLYWMATTSLGYRFGLWLCGIDNR